MASPIHEIKYGSVVLAVFEKIDEKYGTQFSYALNKPYKKDDGTWSKPIYLNNTADLICTIQCIQAVLEYKYRKFKRKSEEIKENADSHKTSVDESQSDIPF